MRIARLLPLLILAALTACGTLYNQQREDTAKTAQKAFSDATLADTFKAERDQNAEILDRELKIAQRESFAQRDLAITNLIVDSAADTRISLKDEIADRMKELIAGTDAEVRASNLSTLRSRDVTLAAAADGYRVVRTGDDPTPHCAVDIRTAAFDVSENAQPAWDAYVKACKAVLESRDTVVEDKGLGQISDATRELIALSSTRDQVVAEVDRLTKQFKERSKKLQDARNAATPSDLKKRAEELQDTLKNIKLPSNTQLASFGLDDARAIAAVRWLDVQTAYVDKVLDAAASSSATTPPPDVDDAIQVASILPAIKADLDKALRYPRVSVLLLESERLRLEHDRMKSALARVDERIALNMAKRDLLMREYRLLNHARATLLDDTATQACAKTLADKNMKLTDMPLMDAPLSCRGPIAGALVQYATAWTIGRAPAESTDWRLINVNYESALDNSESALLQWNNLIAVPLDAIVANAGSGVRPEAVARLVNDAELAIAVAVP